MNNALKTLVSAYKYTRLGVIQKTILPISSHCYSTVVFSQPPRFCQSKASPLYQTARNYAKSKDKKKEKVKTKVHVDENMLSQHVNIENVRNQMERAIENLKDEFTKHLSLRSSAGSIESLIVNVDGTDHTLQELAQIVRKNPKTVVINMAVFPQAIPAALKAIANSGLNLNPQQEGTTLYVPVPKVTKDHRETLAKNAKAIFTKCKTDIRDVQQKQIKALKRKEGLSEDTNRQLQQQLIAIADTYISEAEKILESKQKELLGS